MPSIFVSEPPCPVVPLSVVVLLHLCCRLLSEQDICASIYCHFSFEASPCFPSTKAPKLKASFSLQLLLRTDFRDRN
ncbi:hypothetical protein DFS33DRAFT_1338481 [Desarmillaria ectypa]|nr:hypothetical protein DFS33DRAFT_1338481 [Desarmillaria ectypa]